MEYTSIKIPISLLKRLGKNREYPDQAYWKVIQRFMEYCQMEKKR